MLAFLKRNPTIAALAALAVALLVVVGFETGWGARFRPAIPAAGSGAPPVVEARVLPTVVATAPEQAYPETVARPLFIPTRRPAPTATATAAPTVPRGMFTLNGVTIAGNTRIAMLREKSSGKVHRVEVGREVNGATVAKIEPDRVQLRLGDEHEEVVMTVQKAGAAAPGAVASAAQGPFPSSGPSGTTASVPGGIAAAAGARAPGQVTAGQGATSTPGVPPGMASTAPQPGPIAPSTAQQAPGATTTPMTPEELLARRRARRAQQQ